MVHIYVCGPIKPASKGGAQYFVTIYDDFTAVSSVRLVKAKSDTMENIMEILRRWKPLKRLNG